MTEKEPSHHITIVCPPQPRLEVDEVLNKFAETVALLPTDTDQPTSGRKVMTPARRRWHNAFFRIKVQRAVEKVNTEIMNFGTNELMDGERGYKENLDELLDRKINKKETFRHTSDEKVAFSEKKKLLFYPSSKFKQVWTCLLTIVMIYVATITPYRIAFTEDVFFDGWTIFEYCLDGLFCTDIVINFFSCYQLTDGRIVDNRWSIAFRYLRTWFLIDLVSSVPFNVIDVAMENDGGKGGYNTKLTKLARLPRLYKLFRITRVLTALKHYQNSPFFERMQDFCQVNSRLMKLGKFLVIVSLCIHLMGCLWYFSAKLYEFEPDTWVVRHGFIDENTGYQYLASIYWTVTTIVTVGYGDITARTELEMALAIGWMIVGVGFYSFTVGSLSSFLTSIDTKDSILSSKMAAVKEFAKETNISHEVKIRVREAVRYSTYKMGSVWSDKHSLFNDIPRALQYEVALSMYGGIIKELPFFHNRGRSFVLYFMPIFKPVRMGNEEYLYKDGDFADEMYFISKGRVNLVLFPQEVAYKSYVRGSYLGEIEIIKAIRRIDNAIVFGDSELLSVSKEDFIGALEEFPVEAKEIRRLASERFKRHRQALLETQELLRLKKLRGSLNFLVGKPRLVTIKEPEDTELTTEEYLQK